MPCTPSDQPLGPTKVRNPLDDLKLMFFGDEGPQTILERKLGSFRDFEVSFQRKYGSERERAMRAVLHHRHSRYVHAMNRRSLSYRLDLNHFADRTDAEMAAVRGRKKDVNKEDPSAACGTYVPKSNIPDANATSVDWRGVDQGGPQTDPHNIRVLPAKDQGTCGSCWSYGTTGTIEGQIAKTQGKLVPLSQQNIMDCTWLYGNNACDGGLDYLAYAWMLEQNQGKIATADSYGEYRNQDGFCHYGPIADQDGKMKMNNKNPWTGENVTAGATIGACFHVTKEWNDTTPIKVSTKIAALKDALWNVGPLSVSIDATPRSFYFYAEGWYESDECESGVDDLDHTVLAVGYTEHKGQLYTIVRNSWSSYWGMNGYVYISQNNNTCGVATSPSFAILK